MSYATKLADAVLELEANIQKQRDQWGIQNACPPTWEHQQNLLKEESKLRAKISRLDSAVIREKNPVLIHYDALHQPFVPGARVLWPLNNKFTNAWDGVQIWHVSYLTPKRVVVVRDPLLIGDRSKGCAGKPECMLVVDGLITATPTILPCTLPAAIGQVSPI